MNRHPMLPSGQIPNFFERLQTNFATVNETTVSRNDLCTFISYMGMKSWDLQACDRASMITHVDQEKKISAKYRNNDLLFLWVIDDVAF